MAKTYQDVVTEARVLLQDTDSSAYRYSDANLLAICNRALQALARIRPDACYGFYAANSLNVPELVQSSPGRDQIAWTDDFGLEMQFFNPIISYVVGVAEIVDDEYAEDGRAMMLLQSFKTETIGL